MTTIKIPKGIAAPCFQRFVVRSSTYDMTSVTVATLKIAKNGEVLKTWIFTPDESTVPNSFVGTHDYTTSDTEGLSGHYRVIAELNADGGVIPVTCDVFINVFEPLSET